MNGWTGARQQIDNDKQQEFNIKNWDWHSHCFLVGFDIFIGILGAEQRF